RDNLELMNERGINVPVILGGAALNRRYVDADLVPMYNGKLFYARDAFDGLHAMDDLTKTEAPETAEEAEKARTAAAGNGLKSPAVSSETSDQIETVQTSDDLVGE